MICIAYKRSKKFYTRNIKKEPQINNITNLLDFNKYRKNIENINNELKIKDDIFDIELLPDYQVSNYIKNTSLSIEIKKQKDTAINYLNIYIEKIPTLDNDKKKFYYLEQSWFYQKYWQKLCQAPYFLDTYRIHKNS